MKVLVTGADGLLGSNLVRNLLSKNFEVSVLVHPASKSRTLNGLNVNKFVGDILEVDSLQPALKNCDVVFHAAASTSVWPARSEKIRAINIKGTRNMIDASIANKIEKFIYVGSASAIRGAEQTDNMDGKQHFYLDYIDSKQRAMELVLEAASKEQLFATAILPTFMIGPYDSQPSSGKLILSVARGNVKFYSNGGKNFVHVKDVAEAATNAIEFAENGKYYIAGNENLSYHDFFNKVTKIVGVGEPWFGLPDWVIKSAGAVGSISGRLIQRPPALSYPMACISCEKHYYNISAAVTDLKMSKTPIDQAIEDCFQWFKQEGYC